MPKTYITQEQRDREKIKRILRSRMEFLGIKGCDLADRLKISPQRLSYWINKGTITLADFMAIHRILQFTERDLEALIGSFGKETEW